MLKNSIGVLFPKKCLKTATHDESKEQNPSILNNLYDLEDVIGNGSFGKIFLATTLKDQEKVAIKITSLQEAHVQQLKIENEVLRRLQGGKGICKMTYFSREESEGNYYALVMDYLGPNLEELFRYCGRVFSMKTVCMLAIQMISRIQYMHSKGLIHRDIKPDNFVMGRGKDFNTVYLVDFGLARSYLVPGTTEHIPFVQTKRMMGTARYCSINSHLGLQLSRRDDMQALGYVLVYFAKGRLPWQGIYPKHKEKTEKFRIIHTKKCSTKPAELCAELPAGFTEYMNEVQGHAFAGLPKYTTLKSIFTGILSDGQMTFDNQFDWLERFDYRVKHGKVHTPADFDDCNETTVVGELPSSIMNNTYKTASSCPESKLNIVLDSPPTSNG